MLFTCKNFVFRFCVEKNFLLHEMMGKKGGANASLPSFFLFSAVLWKYYEHMLQL